MAAGPGHGDRSTSASLSAAAAGPRLVDARQTLERLTSSLGRYRADGHRTGAWSTEQDEGLAADSGTAREDMIDQGSGGRRQRARGCLLDHAMDVTAVLAEYEDFLPRIERTAIGVSVIFKRSSTITPGPAARPIVRDAGDGCAVLALAGAVRASVQAVLDRRGQAEVASSFAEVRVRRERWRGASGAGWR